MQKKIFRVMTLIVAISLTAFSLIIGGICYSFYKDTAHLELKSVADIICSTNSDESFEEMNQVLKDNLKYHVRITYIDSDGVVKYDSDVNVDDMENHLKREEVQDALENGSGESTRVSSTINKTVYYYAVKYDDGVLRFARERNNLFSIFLIIIPIIISVAGGIFVITTIVSIRLSESLIKPINKLVSQLDLQSADGFDKIETPYEELAPIIKNADILFKKISKNLSKLKKEKEKITLITDNMVEGMVLLDSDYTVLSVNQSALNLLNPEFDPHTHGKLSQLTTNSEIMTLLERFVEEGAVRGVVSIKNRKFRTFINKSDYADGYGIIILFVDVTESLKSEQIRRDFSANVSHELKTPLTTIKGFGEMMDNGIITSPQEIKKYGGTIYRESERLLSLINDIIRLSEIEEHDNGEVEEIDLLSTARDVEEILQHRNATVIVRGEHVKIHGSQSYITELMLNLMDNAIKYNNDDAKVWVDISSSPTHAIIVVKDNGIGIAPKDQERVFERFYRVDKSRSKQTGGTGLGLSIVKHIVADHNGSIGIVSELGKGTEITITLPFDDEKE